MLGPWRAWHLSNMQLKLMNHGSPSYVYCLQLLFLSLPLCPVTVLPYCLQNVNTLHLWGICTWRLASLSVEATSVCCSSPSAYPSPSQKYSSERAVQKFHTPPLPHGRKAHFLSGDSGVSESNMRAGSILCWIPALDTICYLKDCGTLLSEVLTVRKYAS